MHVLFLNCLAVCSLLSEINQNVVCIFFCRIHGSEIAQFLRRYDKIFYYIPVGIKLVSTNRYDNKQQAASQFTSDWFSAS